MIDLFFYINEMDTLIKRARYNYAKLEYAKSVGMFTVNYSKYLSEELIEVEIFIGN